MVGDRDAVCDFPGGRGLAANLKTYVPRLTRTIVLEGCGHWIQQERPAEVNAAIVELLKATLAR
jgi:pimeloyl-ACP methyl ester carboxylesterase